MNFVGSSASLQWRQYGLDLIPAFLWRLPFKYDYNFGGFMNPLVIYVSAVNN